MKSVLILFILTIGLTNLSNGQQPNDINSSVGVNAEYSKVDKTITLNWEKHDNATGYFIFEREIGASSTWGSPIATLSATDSVFTIENVEIGHLNEYQVLRNMTSGSASGYAYTGIEYQPTRFGKKIIVIIETMINDSLPEEILRYTNDLEAEGWEVSKIIVDQEDSAENVKNAILAIYETDPNAYRMVSILGHVQVPYSGNIVPDGHSNHVGAWPCDGYYGDMDGVWTDNFVTNETAAQQRNRNVPGDGKWDQSTYPSQIELGVGRVDFSNLPLFDEGEIELTRKYLEKNHKFRVGKLKSKHRGSVENNFSLAEGFGQNGYRNIGALVGRDSTFSRDYDVLKSDTYLWSYGAGGGNYQGASGISNTTNFTQDSIQSIFTMLFGSYFGDFDSNNNFLRAALGTGTILSNAWAGRPHWHFHPMGMGSMLGDCTVLTMNNPSYAVGIGNKQVHIALIGDPTLKMIYPAPPSNLEIEHVDGKIKLKWDASLDPDIDGYRIYRAINNGEPMIVDSLVLGSAFEENCFDEEKYTYYIAAVRVEEGFTGSYFNESQHLSTDIGVTNVLKPDANFTFGNDELEVEFLNTSLNSSSYLWSFGDGQMSEEENPIHTYSSDGSYLVTLMAFDAQNCHLDSSIQEVTVMITNIDDLDYGLKVFPNPVKDRLTILADEKIDKVKIYNDFGKLMKIVNVNNAEVAINLGELQNGFYNVEILFANHERIVDRILKVE